MKILLKSLIFGAMIYFSGSLVLATFIAVVYSIYCHTLEKPGMFIYLIHKTKNIVAKIKTKDMLSFDMIVAHADKAEVFKSISFRTCENYFCALTGDDNIDDVMVVSEKQFKNLEKYLQGKI